MPPLTKGFRAHLTVRRSLWAVALSLVVLVALVTTGASASSPSCSYFASTSGSDSNPGTSTSPFLTVSRLLSALAAGQTGCLGAGQTFVGDLTISRGGAAGAPITITSADTTNPATIRGRIVTKPGGNWLTFSYLNLDGINSSGLPSPTIGSDYVTLSHDDITNEHTAICINVIDSSTWGTGHYTTIDANRIHGCGKLPAQNHDHGVYDSSYYTTVTNNLIYDNADRGVQLRGDHGAVVKYNVIDGNGEGVIFGDLSSSNNSVVYNIVSNSVIRSNVESYWGSTPVGTGNVFDHNCVFASNADSYYNANGGVNTSAGGYSVSNVTIGDPAYTSRAAADYRLNSTSACTGFGVQAGVTPGPAGSGTATPTAPSATSAPSISGVAQNGQTLTAAAGGWSGTAPLAYAFQWRHCDAIGAACADIPGATSAFEALSSADVGSTLRVTVTGSNSVGSATATSLPTGVVASASPPPVPASSFAVTQTVSDGATLSGSVTWTASPTGATVDHVDFLIDGVVKWSERDVPYQFNGDNTPFDTTTLADGVHALAATAYSTTGETASVTSNVTVRNAVPPAVIAAPTISGKTRINRQLTSTSGSWNGTAPMGYSFRWLRCNSGGSTCDVITGATAPSYTVKSADIGKSLRSQVIVQNSAGSASAKSAATSTVLR